MMLAMTETSRTQTRLMDPERLRKAAYVARGITIFLFLALFIIWPLT
jgi:hypothetical protein